MGQRANLIIVENGEYTLRYDHWVANRLGDVLFWDAKYALRYFEAQETVGEHGWLDDVWAEGGAVVDLDKKYLLWYGGEDLMYEVPLRRTFLELQTKVWRGWEIEWANRGIVDLAEYVGVPREKVLPDRTGIDTASKIEIPAEPGWMNTLGSIRLAGGETKVFPLNYDTIDYLRNGLDLLEQCRTVENFENLVWSEWNKSGDFPTGGFYLDEKQKTVEFWEARDCPDTVNELKRVWDDWDVVWHADNYEFQLEKLGHRVVLPEIDRAALIERLRTGLMRENENFGIQSFLEVTELLEKENKSVQINEWALKSHHVENPLEIKKQIWENYFPSKK